MKQLNRRTSLRNTNYAWINNFSKLYLNHSNLKWSLHSIQTKSGG